MSYNSKYFDRKPSSLENAVLEALGGQINEASVTTDLDDDPKLFKQIERMGVKVKKNGKPQDGYQEVTLSGPQAKIDAANKKLNLLPEAKDMDKVNPDAVKKKFKDRKDKDIDNDGDVDSSDEYLHKRRKAISKAVKSEGIFTGLQKKGSDDSQAGAQTRSYQRQYGQGAKVGNPHRQMEFAKAAFKNGMKSRSGIVSYVEKETKSKIHPDVQSAINNSVKKEEVELGEGKMKELAGKIATVYKKMKSDSTMKPFADKFRADVKKSMNIKKSLEKVLPDYVGGGDITKLMSEASELGTPERTKHTLDVTPGQSMEDWNKAVGVMQEKNDTMREALAKMWGVEESNNKNPFGEAADFKPHKMYDPKTGEAHDAKTMDDHLRMKKMGYTHTEPKKEQKTMTGQPATKVTVDPDMKEKKNIA
jgi:hypothetical protein